MGASSAHGPRRRDGDLARHPDDAPVPWEPVVTRPDPMTAGEWEACLADEGLDPEAYPDEDEFWSPDALDLTEVELAEIREAAELAAPVAADDLDTAGVAAALAAQAAAASARRRGPGQPGSARHLARESSSAAAAFGTGLPLDVMPACPDLAVLAGRAAGPGDSYAGASDDELAGVVCAWDRLESHMAARKLAAVAELSRRRPVIETPASGRAAGTAGEDFTADELAHVLAISRRGAGRLLIIAEALDGKLPGTRAALRDGIITPVKAQIIVTATTVLTGKEPRAAEARVLDRAGRITPGSLRAAIARAVMEVAPKKAKKRREQAARNARVERWGEDSGNGALAGRELPPAQVLAMDQKITWQARQLKRAGLEGDMDQLRARALADLVLGTDSRPGHHGTAGSPGPVPAGFAANVNLTVPLATTLDLADRPGELPGFGPVDPWLARDLARAAAASPKTTWCVTVTDADGHAIGHGCARPQPSNHARRGKRDGPGRPGGTGTRGRPGSGFSFTPDSRDGPPGGYGTWTLPSSGTWPGSGTPPAPAPSAGGPQRGQLSRQAGMEGTQPGQRRRGLCVQLSLVQTASKRQCSALAS